METLFDRNELRRSLRTVGSLASLDNAERKYDSLCTRRWLDDARKPRRPAKAEKRIENLRKNAWRKTAASNIFSRLLYEREEARRARRKTKNVKNVFFMCFA